MTNPFVSYSIVHLYGGYAVQRKRLFDLTTYLGIDGSGYWWYSNLRNAVCPTVEEARANWKAYKARCAVREATKDGTLVERLT